MSAELAVWPRAGRQSQAELFCDQVAAISHWHRRRRAEQATAAAALRAGVTREQRLDLARRMEVLRREHEALIRRTHEQLRESVALLDAVAPARAVVAHHSGWFTKALTAALHSHGVTVVADPPTGADAVGVAVAEQPDLVLVAGVLTMMSSEHVIREIRAFSRCALVAAQATTDDQISRLLDAGAHIAFTCRIAPDDLADELSRLMFDVPQPALSRPRDALNRQGGATTGVRTTSTRHS